VTAIRSTAGILSGSETLEPEWLARFHRNLLEDAKRLAGNAQALVAQLDASDGNDSAGPSLPKEDLENWLMARGFHIAALENGAVSVDDLLAAEDRLNSSATLHLHAQAYLERYRRDAVVVPMDKLLAAWDTEGFDPLQFSQQVGCDLACVLRRLACLPADKADGIGLVVCDNSGTLTFSKPVANFALPRFGAACPMWPLFQALSRPGVPIRTAVEQSGQTAMRYVTFAVAQPVTAPGFTVAPLYEATMLILSDDGANGDALAVGSSCRICPRETCHGRREPSILTSGF